MRGCIWASLVSLDVVSRRESLHCILINGYCLRKISLVENYLQNFDEGAAVGRNRNTDVRADERSNLSRSAVLEHSDYRSAGVRSSDSDWHRIIATRVTLRRRNSNRAFDSDRRWNILCSNDICSR